MKPVRPNGKKNSIHFHSLFDQKHFDWTLHLSMYFWGKKYIRNVGKKQKSYKIFGLCLPKQWQTAIIQIKMAGILRERV